MEKSGEGCAFAFAGCGGTRQGVPAGVAPGWWENVQSEDVHKTPIEMPHADSSGSRGLQNRLNTVMITGMNVDRILSVLNRNKVAYLLIGGVNFLLRHAPVLTCDVDVWIEDTEKNLAHCEKALAQLKAEWGEKDDDWRPVKDRVPGWLRRQTVFCLSSPDGGIDVFRAVKGLEDWRASFSRSARGKTEGGVAFHGLSDEDMLSCQKALGDQEQKKDRVRMLNRAIKRKTV